MADSGLERLAALVARRCEAELSQRALPLDPLLFVRGAVTSVDRLADLWLGWQGQRFVITGEVGSGRSTVAAALAATLLRRRREGQPVPVLLDGESWSASDLTVHMWASKELAGTGIDTGRPPSADAMTMVLDGVRAPAPHLRGSKTVGGRLRDDLGDDLGVILCCDTAVLADVEQWLWPTTTVWVLPLGAGTVADLLIAQADQRWALVAQHLTDHPEDPIARVLTVPDSLALAVTAYGSGGNPAELLGLDRDDVERRLVERFESAVGCDAATRAHLGFLARHLAERRSTSLAWWRLAAAVPELVRGLSGQLGLALITAVIWWLPTHSAAAAGFGFGFGMAWGTLVWPSDGVHGFVAWRVVLTAGFVSGVSAALGSWVGVAFAAGFGLLMGWALGRRPGAAFALAAGTLALGVSAWGPLVGMVILAGVFVGLVWGWGFYAVLLELRWKPGRFSAHVPYAPKRAAWLFALGFGMGLITNILVVISDLAGLWFGLLIALSWGLIAAASVWLNAPAPTYAGDGMQLLIRDRRAAISQGMLTGAVASAGLVSAVTIIIKGGPQKHFDLGESVSVVAAMGVLGGVALTLTSAWGGFGLARAYLAARGHLPLRLMTFLQQQVLAGTLVEVAGTYRFHYILHRDHLERHTA